MSFKKLCSLAISLLTIPAASLSVSAMESKPTSSAVENQKSAKIESKACVWGKFGFGIYQNDDIKFYNFYVDEDNTNKDKGPIFSLLDDNKCFVNCSICHQPLRSGEEFGIFNCNGNLTSKNNNDKFRDLFMKMIDHSYHLKCRKTKLNKLEEQLNRCKSTNNFGEMLKLLQDLATALYNCPKCNSHNAKAKPYCTFKFSSTDVV